MGFLSGTLATNFPGRQGSGVVYTHNNLCTQRELLDFVLSEVCNQFSLSIYFVFTLSSSYSHLPRERFLGPGNSKEIEYVICGCYNPSVNRIQASKLNGPCKMSKCELKASTTVKMKHWSLEPRSLNRSIKSCF